MNTFPRLFACILTFLCFVPGCGDDEVVPQGSFQLELERTWGEPPSGVLVRVEDLDFAPDGTALLLDNGLDRVQEITPGGSPGEVWSRPDGGTFGDIPRLSRAPDGTVYVLSRRLILKFTGDGTMMDVLTDLPSGDSGPSFLDLAADDAGNVWTVERVTPGVRKYSPSGALLDSWVAFEPDTVISITSTRIDLDDQGRVFLCTGGAADSVENIFVYTTGGTLIRSWSLPETMFTGQMGIAVDGGGTVFIHDQRNSRVLRYASSGTLEGEWDYDTSEIFQASIAIGPGDDPFLFSLTDRALVRVDRDLGTYTPEVPTLDVPFLLAPRGIGVDLAGRTYILDQGDVDVFDAGGDPVDSFDLGWDLLGVSPNGAIVGWRNLDTQLQRIDSGGDVLSSVDAPEIRCDVMYGPALDANENAYFAGAGCFRILKYDEAGDLLSQWNFFIGSEFPLAPRWMTVDPFDDLLVLDTGRRQVHRFRPDGERIDSMALAPPMFDPASLDGGLAADEEGRFFVAYAVPNLVQAYDGNGEFLGSWEDPAYDAGLFWRPAGLAVAPNGNLLVVDARKRRVRELRIVEVPG